jgi:ornithine carbamoyltransferase
MNVQSRSTSAGPPETAKPRHFLELADFDPETLRGILARGAAYKRVGRIHAPVLAGKTVALLFEKPSTRTRVSFELAVHQLGGHAVVLSDRDMQLGRGESVADTARVLSRYVDAIMLRTGRVSKLEELASHASVPVINGLTDASHPCQLLADILTFEEHRGPIAGQLVTWCGDGNNVARTWVQAAARFGFSLRLASPASCEIPANLLAWARREGADVTTYRDPLTAARGARAVVTDCWVSMADDPGRNSHADLAPFRVTQAVMAQAAPDALFMHCLPAHRGEEVETSVIDGPQSAVFDEAENRLHAHKGILAWALDRPPA